METFLYMTSTGWKSGNAHQIEIWYVEHDGKYYIVAEHRERTHWLQNIQHNPAITFRVGEAEFSGVGRVIDGDSELAATVSTLMDEKYDWSAGTIVELAPDA
jgi:deazaflavin-dependent oxidoreductase (nitroreductase family)